jgi:hypothetical protein
MKFRIFGDPVSVFARNLSLTENKWFRVPTEPRLSLELTIIFSCNNRTNGYDDRQSFMMWLR